MMAASIINTHFIRKHPAQTVLTVLGFSGVVLIFLPFADDEVLATVFLEWPPPLPPFDRKHFWDGIYWFLVPLVVLPFAISAGYLRWLLTGHLSRGETWAGYGLALLAASSLVLVLLVDWLLKDWLVVHVYPLVAFGAGAGFLILNLRGAAPPAPNALVAMQVVYLPIALPLIWVVGPVFDLDSQIGYYLGIVTVIAYSAQIVMAAKRSWQVLIFLIPLALVWSMTCLSLSATQLGTLWDAAARGNLDRVERLIAVDANVNANDDNGNTPLHIAVTNGHATVTALLITKGAKVNAKNKNGNTPLHAAAYQGEKALAELLIAKGAKVNVKDKYGRTPLNLAESNGHMNIVELLREHGAKE